jgi:DNA-binding Xre family transcriptional regulator
MNETSKKRLSWRLRVMMAERNISTATELQRLLEKSGYQITSSQLTRVIKDRPDRISTDLLDHLLAVLNCGIGDLLRSDAVSADGATNGNTSANNAATAKSKKLRVRREPVVSAPGDDLTGPKVTAFPLPDRKK